MSKDDIQWVCWVFHCVLFVYICNTSNRVLLKALLFVKSSQYVNTARIDPSLLVVESSWLRVHDKKSLAICIMMGTVMESFVVDSCEAGPCHSPYPIHKVTISPLEQDWHRDASVWRLLFEFCTIVGMYLELGFGFATHGEGKAMVGKTVWLLYDLQKFCSNCFHQPLHHLCQLKTQHRPQFWRLLLLLPVCKLWIYMLLLILLTIKVSLHLSWY